MNMDTIILEWLTNKPINHQDSEEPLTAEVIILLINYTKMEREMDFQDILIPMENIILVNTSMDNLMEFGNTTIKKECYINMKNGPKANLLKSGD